MVLLQLHSGGRPCQKLLPRAGCAHRERRNQTNACTQTPSGELIPRALLRSLYPVQPYAGSLPNSRLPPTAWDRQHRSSMSPRAALR